MPRRHWHRGELWWWLIVNGIAQIAATTHAPCGGLQLDILRCLDDYRFRGADPFLLR